MNPMHFAAATDRAKRASITMADVARACGVSENTIHRARRAPDDPDSRPAPSGWRANLARLCRERAQALTKLADTLEREG